LIGALLGLALGGSIATGGWLLRYSEPSAVAAADVPKFAHAFEPKKRSSSADEEPSIFRLAALLLYSAVQSAPKR